MMTSPKSDLGPAGLLEPRVRSINFSVEEKRVLTSLISKHPSINTKFCDNGSLSAKHISWSEVYDRFCRAFPTQPLRDIKQLKGCWKRLKMKRKMHPFEPSKWFGADDSPDATSGQHKRVTTNTTIRDVLNNNNSLCTSFNDVGATPVRGQFCAIQPAPVAAELKQFIISKQENSLKNLVIANTEPKFEIKPIVITSHDLKPLTIATHDVISALQQNAYTDQNASGQHIQIQQDPPAANDNGQLQTYGGIHGNDQEHYRNGYGIHGDELQTNGAEIMEIGEISNNNIIALPQGSRRKNNTPRRLPVRPATSYLRPPVSTITDMSNGRDDIDREILAMAQQEHRAKMRILQLKKWKLKQECLELKIGLPPEYTSDSDDDI